MTTPHITKKQKEIPLNLYKFRCLNRTQIQKLLNNKDYRNTNAWLKDLVQKDYIVRIEDEQKFPPKPSKYRISINGIRLLRQNPNVEKTYLTKLYQEDRRSTQFQNISMLIADTYLNLLEKNTDPSIRFKFYTQADFPKDGSIRKIKPTFAYIKESKHNIENFMCEIMEPDMPWGAVSGRIKRLVEFFAEDEDESTNIIFICPDARIYRSVGRYTRRLMREQEYGNLKLYQTTYDGIREGNLGERIEIK